LHRVITLLLGAHLACAFTATAAFWAAAFAEKGGPRHRAVGRWFAILIYATASSGGLMGLIGLVTPLSMVQLAGTEPAELLARLARTERQTMAFVFYVLVIIVAPVQHGLAVVSAGAEPRRVRSRAHSMLNLAGMLGTALLLFASVVWQRWVFLLVVPAGLAIGLRNMAYASRGSATPSDWEREHLTSLLTAGITLHTALLVFGSSRALGMQLAGVAALIPWLLPATLGLPVIWRLRRC
jgi:uncharacterized membrane protein